MTNKKRYPMPIPFGWYVIDYADELKVGDVKSVRYFAQDQVLFRTNSGEVSIHCHAWKGHSMLIALI